MVLDLTDRLYTKYFLFGRYRRKKCECDGTINQLFVDFKKTYDTVKRDVLYNILTEFGIPKKLD